MPLSEMLFHYYCCKTNTLLSLWCSKEGCPNPQSALAPSTFHSRFPEEQAPEKREDKKSPKKLIVRLVFKENACTVRAMRAAHRTRVPIRGFMRQRDAIRYNFE